MEFAAAALRALEPSRVDQPWQLRDRKECLSGKLLGHGCLLLPRLTHVLSVNPTTGVSLSGIKAPVMDWKECAAVETVPGRLSGAPVIKGSRVRPDDLVINRAEGEAWLAENYNLPVERVRDVLSFYDRHKPAP